jgi:uncharacterized protein (DUF169 family)
MVGVSANKLKDILGLATEPVAVFLLASGAEPGVFDGFEVTGHRYCQLLMRARRGESLRLLSDDLACPAAASAFGFKPLPEGLATGKGLCGFGIVAEAATGKAMFDGMTRLPAGSVEAIAVCPLGTAPGTPDVVVVEGAPEQLMWLALADLNLAGGTRRRADTAVLQAVCVDATVVPFVEKRLNFSLGCYGCREATDIGADETILGFPGASLGGIVAALEELNVKAIARSRAKAAYRHLTRNAGTEKNPAHPLAATAPLSLPQLTSDIVIKLSPRDVAEVYRAVIDSDRESALAFVEERIHREIRAVLDRPHCSPVFEMHRKLREGG